MQFLHKGVQQQRDFNQQVLTRNNLLQMKINDLQHGHELLEEYARQDLGMVKEGETLYQIITP